MTETEESSNTFLIRPKYEHKFRVPVVKDCIKELLREHLSGVQYNPEEIPSLTQTLTEAIKDRIKDLDLDRYKLVVHVTIGEQRGQGVTMMSRCFWDSDTDGCAKEVYMNKAWCAWLLYLECIITDRGPEALIKTHTPHTHTHTRLCFLCVRNK